MESMPKIAVSLDGKTFEVQLAQGDYVRAEAQGYSHDDFANGGFGAVAAVSFHALQRAKRRGVITVELPETFEDYLDVFDMSVDQPEDDDPEGKGSGQEATTG